MKFNLPSELDNLNILIGIPTKTLLSTSNPIQFFSKCLMCETEVAFTENSFLNISQLIDKNKKYTILICSNCDRAEKE